jgi:ABC-2 type transport system ATP-binding protein
MITVQDLTKEYGDFLAVDRVSFEVGTGEIFGFLGPNGAGKTTTIRMLCGILKPTSGSGQVAGYDISTENEQIKRHIGYMSQRFSLYPDLTVQQNMDFFSSIYGLKGSQKRAREQWALATAGLESYIRRITRDIPIGYKQRLGLVCALLHEPQIVFLDEPTAGVDPSSRRTFWETIYQLKEQKKTTVFVTTHYMDEAEHCERIALIQNGRIAALGRPQELKKSLQAAIFLVQGQPSEPIPRLLVNKKNVLNIVPFGLAFHIFFENSDAARAGKKTLQAGGVRLERFEPVPPSLEDVFIATMEKDL